jgi:hypothetical protein
MSAMDFGGARGDNRPMPATEKEVQTIEPWMAWIALATLLAVGSVAVFTAWDRMRTAELEQVVTPTAVGDTHYVSEPVGGTGSIGLKYQGQDLQMLSENKIRDSKMIQAGTDDTGVYSLYRSEDEKVGAAKERLYMKVKEDEFIEVR